MPRHRAGNMIHRHRICGVITVRGQHYPGCSSFMKLSLEGGRTKKDLPTYLKSKIALNLWTKGAMYTHPASAARIACSIVNSVVARVLIPAVLSSCVPVILAKSPVPLCIVCSYQKKARDNGTVWPSLSSNIVLGEYYGSISSHRRNCPGRKGQGWGEGEVVGPEGQGRTAR